MSRVIVDVREPSEYLKSHVEGALNIPPSSILGGVNVLSDLPKDTEIILYCNSGSRSSVAMNIMGNLGFTNLVNGINKDHVQAKYIS